MSPIFVSRASRRSGPEIGHVQTDVADARCAEFAQMGEIKRKILTANDRRIKMTLGEQVRQGPRRICMQAVDLLLVGASKRIGSRIDDLCVPAEKVRLTNQRHRFRTAAEQGETRRWCNAQAGIPQESMGPLDRRSVIVESKQFRTDPRFTMAWFGLGLTARTELQAQAQPGAARTGSGDGHTQRRGSRRHRQNQQLQKSTRIFGASAWIVTVIGHIEMNELCSTIGKHTSRREGKCQLQGAAAE